MSKTNDNTATAITEEIIAALFNSEYVLDRRTASGEVSPTLKLLMSGVKTTHPEEKERYFKGLKSKLNLQPDQPVSIGRYTLVLPSVQKTSNGQPCNRIDITYKDDLAMKLEALGF